MAEMLRNIGAIWQRASLSNRVLLLAVLLMCAGAGVMLVRWSTQPSLALLYSRLDPEEAARIAEKVRDAGVAYELRDGGTTIYVAEESVYDLRMVMAGQGLPSSSQAGYSVLDKEKIGTSPFAQQVNYIRAVEGELRRNIEMIDAVDSARVKIAKAESKLFGGPQSATTASVVVRLKGGQRLSGDRVATIQYLVAGGVDGLTPDNVTVADTQGNLLSSEKGNSLARKAGNYLDYKTRVEEYLGEKAEALLAAALGPGRARVKVSAAVDISEVATESEKYDAATKVVSTEEIAEKSTTSPPPAAGAAAGGDTTDNITKTDYFPPPKTLTREEKPPGRIESVQVAAFVDLSPPQAKEGETASPAAALTVDQVKQIIMSAIGVAKIEDIQVIDTLFPRPEAPAEDVKEAGFLTPEFLLQLARRASLGILVVGALLVMKIFGAAKKGAAATEGGAALALKAPAGQAGSLLPAGQASPSAEALRAQITRALRENPEEVRRLFLNWVESPTGEA